MSTDAGFVPGQDVTYKAGADLSTKQYYAVELNSSGEVVVAGAGEFFGVLQNKPTSGQAATVRLRGRTKWLTAAVMTPGAYVASDAAGKAATATKASTDTQSGAAADPLVGSIVAGRYVGASASASGDYAEVELGPLGAIPTTLA